VNRVRFGLRLAVAAAAAMLACSQPAPPVVFQRTYGGAGEDYGGAVQQTADGGYVVTSWTKELGTRPDFPERKSVMSRARGGLTPQPGAVVLLDVIVSDDRVPARQADHF
jgi:hypothetical protein